MSKNIATTLADLTAGVAVPQRSAPLCAEHGVSAWQCAHASDYTTIDGMDVESGESGDEWAVQTYTPGLPRGQNRRSIRTYDSHEQAEHAAARWRGKGVGFGAWVRDLRDVDGGWL